MDTNKIVKFWLNQTNRDWQATKICLEQNIILMLYFFAI